MANNKMNIIEALVKLRDDLKTWVTNNLKTKADKEEVDAAVAAVEEKIPIVDYPVISVNGKTGDVNLNASDVGALPANTQIPSISGLASEDYVDAKVAAVANQNAFSNITVGDSTIKADGEEDTLTFVGENITITPNLLTDAITFSVGSATITTKGIVQLEDSVESDSTTTAATPKSVKQAYDLANTAKADAAAAKVTVVDNLTSAATTSALSANQGRLLNEAINSITTDLGNLGGGDMMKATYDKDGDGVVDNAEKLGGHDVDYFASAADLAATDAKIPPAYSLPVATADALGGVKVGTGLSITNGVLSANVPEINYPVTSVNTKTGAVSLTAADVGAVPIDTYSADKANFATKEELTPISQAASNAETKANNLESRLEGIVATGGEPNTINTIKVNGTALTVDAQKAVNISVPTTTSELTNNSGYLTEHQSLAGYAKTSDIPDVSSFITMSDIEAKNYLTSIPSEYVTETELNNKGYLTAHQSIGHLATTEYVNGQITTVEGKIPEVINNLTSTSTTKALSAAQGKALKDTVDDIKVPTKVSELSNDKNYLTSIPSEYVTESELTGKGYLTSGSLTDYATKNYVSTEIANAKLDGGDVDLTGYATKDDIKDFITAAEIPAEYVTESELNAALPEINDDESHELTIEDSAGNVITRIDANGVSTTTVMTDSLVVNGKIFSENDYAKKEVLPCTDALVLPAGNLKGDVDGDGLISLNDAELIRRHVMNIAALTGDALTRAEVSGDSKITALDYALVKKFALTDNLTVSGARGKLADLNGKWQLYGADTDDAGLWYYDVEVSGWNAADSITVCVTDVDGSRLSNASIELVQTGSTGCALRFITKKVPVAAVPITIDIIHDAKSNRTFIYKEPEVAKYSTVITLEYTGWTLAQGEQAGENEDVYTYECDNLLITADSEVLCSIDPTQGDVELHNQWHALMRANVRYLGVINSKIIFGAFGERPGCDIKMRMTLI